MAPNPMPQWRAFVPQTLHDNMREIAQSEDLTYARITRFAFRLFVALWNENDKRLSALLHKFDIELG